MALLAYLTATFVSAFLLFLVQPMLARMILPLYGGVPLVWTTMLAFFQTLLLLGYVYVFLLDRLVNPRLRAWGHLALVALPLLTLPLQLPVDAAPPSGDMPVWWLLRCLAITVGPTFLLVSTTSPLLQRWFTGLRHQRAGDPYFLYVASNAGSLAALVAYPLLLEPELSLAQQSALWMAGYALLVVLLIPCTLLAVRGMSLQLPAAAQPRSALTWRRRGRWVLLALLPASLLGSITSYITTDLASIPLWWVVPLIIYLASFILVFANPPLWSKRLGPTWLAYVLPVMAVGFGRSHNPWFIALNVVGYGLAVMFCHGELAADRPGVDRLTEFYVWMAVGGAVGGVFNAIVAPALFDSVVEYPLSLAAVACVAFAVESQRWRLRDILWMGGSAGAIAIVCWACQRSDVLTGASVAALGLGAIPYRKTPIRLALASTAILLTVILVSPSSHSDNALLAAQRSFFGVYRVGMTGKGQMHYLLSGTTVHGMQSTNEAARLQPLTYYYPTGPGGQAMQALLPHFATQPVAVVGLGTGALACYARPGQRWDFYELDPVVERMARDPRLFTYLRDCPGHNNVITGDARLSLQAAPSHHYGMIVLDAYGSDSIPVHLLTREAMQLYLDKLTDDGVLLFHVTNRHYDLPRVVAAVAAQAGMITLLRQDSDVPVNELELGKTPSIWMAASRSHRALAPLSPQPQWQAVVRNPDDPLWTDDFSSVMAVLRL